MVVNVAELQSDLCTTSFTSTTDPADQFRVSFSAISNQEVTRQTWRFISADSSHNTTLTEFNPTYKFPDTGYYYVLLETVTATGCKGLYWNYVRITAATTSNNAIVTPNPVIGSRIDICVKFNKTEAVAVTVFNTSGNQVYASRYMASVGTNLISIPVDKLQRGIYYIHVRGAVTVSKSTFIKM
jgi:hypothetical protein